MRWWSKLLVMALVLGLVGVADAKGHAKKGGKPKAHPHLRHRHVHRKHERKGSQAIIEKVSGSDVTVSMHATGHRHGRHHAIRSTLHRRRAGTATFHTTSQTLITVNGVGGKSVGNLHKGQRAALGVTGNTAKTIVAVDGVAKGRVHRRKKK